MYVAMLLVLLKSRVLIAADVPEKRSSAPGLAVDVRVSPPAPQLMFVRTQLRVSIVVTSVDNSTCVGSFPTCLTTMSVSSYRPTTVVALTTPGSSSTDPANNTLTDLRFRVNQSVVVVVHALSVGRAVLTFEVSTASADVYTDDRNISMTVDDRVDIRYKTLQVEGSGNAAGGHSANAAGGRQLVPGSSPSSHLLAVIEYHLTVARRRRWIDDGFFLAVMTATLLNAFGLGCVTVHSDVRQELRKPRPSALATLLCQFVVLPPVYMLNSRLATINDKR